jgi:hypothetical protein
MADERIFFKQWWLQKRASGHFTISKFWISCLRQPQKENREMHRQAVKITCRQSGSGERHRYFCRLSASGGVESLFQEAGCAVSILKS